MTTHADAPESVVVNQPAGISLVDARSCEFYDFLFNGVLQLLKIGDSTMKAQVLTGADRNSVDKLRLSITYWRRDCAKLQRDSIEGLNGFNGALSFGVDQELELFLISSKSYSLVLEGDLVQTDYDDVGEHSMRKFMVGWSNSAKQCGTGSGVVKLVNPLRPESPCCFSISVGSCVCDCPSGD